MTLGEALEKMRIPFETQCARVLASCALAATLAAAVLCPPRAGYAATCGNGLLEAGETCDDGNLNSGDGCEAACTLSPGCALYPASGLPITIPTVGQITSTVTVTLTGSVGEVEVIGLSGTHTFIQDVAFQLTSPANTSVIFINHVCGSQDNFNLSVDDDATTAIPCPPTDAKPHLPSAALSAFQGQAASGVWTLTVADTAAGDGGSLAAWTLKVCSAQCGNGVTETGEQCDDGNLLDGDNCDSNCTPTGCGNGIVTAGEACDDGNLVDGDNCRSNCTVEECGDNIQDPQEECDDGNLVDGDGCESDCTLPCPASLCNCLKDAGLFDLVAGKLSMKPGKVTIPGYGGYPGTSYFVPSSVAGGACTVTGTLSGKSGGLSELGSDLVSTAPAGKPAFKFKGYKEYGYLTPGVSVGGDLVTAGGKISGLDAVTVGGNTDTTGAHPQVPVCTSAMTDAKTASATLKALPANSTLGPIKVAAGDDYTINAGAGVWVVSTPSIKILSKKYFGYPQGGTLTIHFGPDTETVVINVEKSIAIAAAGKIVVDGNPEDVVLNVHNGKGKIKIAADGSVDPAILAPLGAAGLSRGALVGNLIGLKKLGMKGSSVGDVLGCIP